MSPKFKHNLTWSVIGLFFIWILPLGAFISQEKEKQACDGQRAICLCSHLLAKKLAKGKGKILMVGNGHVQKESPGGAGSDFLAQAKLAVIRPANFYGLLYRETFYAHLSLTIIDHVPKNSAVIS